MNFEKKGEIFNADATYMIEEYRASLNSEPEKLFFQDEALDILGWDTDQDGWGDEFWADIVISRSGNLLAIVAEGEWGQPSTYYHAVCELQVDKK